MRRVSLVSAALGAATALLGACGPPDSEPTPDRPGVVVSVPPQAYFVERLAGDLVEIEVMIPPGASPATHEPTIGQLRALARASIYLKVGHPNFPFEKTWLAKLLDENPGLTVVDASAGSTPRVGDPHLWVSPGGARRMAQNAAAALREVLPQEASRIDANLAGFLADIDALDVDLRTALAGHAGKSFFVFHPAWGYFAEEYDLRQIAVERHGKEPSPGELASLIDEARAKNVRVLFVQPQFSRASAEIVAREIGGRVVAVDPLARDWLANMRRVAHAFAEALAS